MIEYFSRDRTDPESFLDKWDRWVRDDWHRAYIMKLGKLGLDIPPDIFERARERIVAGVHHRHAIFMFAAWPFANWRMDPLDDRDFEWFENKYPGWYAQYGAFFEAYRHGHRTRTPASCRSSSSTSRRRRAGPARASASPRRTAATGSSMSRTRFYCSQECRWLDESNPGRYTGDRNFFDRYHGWEASEVVRDLGFVRADGETHDRPAAPRVRPALDARRHPRNNIDDPQRRTSASRGSSGCRPATTRDCVPGDGSVPLELAVSGPADRRALCRDEGPVRADRRGDRVRAR